MDEKKPKNSHNKNFIVTILVLAATRTFIFNAAFPPHNNVDEDAHIDMVQKYSKGYIPKKSIEKFDSSTIELLLLHAGREYLSDANSSKKVPEPLFKYPEIIHTREFKDKLDTYRNKPNHEAGSFPVYYLWAGLWWFGGKSIGIKGGDLIYLIRFLNIPVFLGLVWIAYLTGKKIFPNNIFQQKALPIMVAFFPQDIFYSINNDVLSPLLFSLSFLMLIKILLEDKPLRFYFFTAAVISLTLLNKVTNITILILLAIVAILKLKHIIIEKKFKEKIFRLLALLAVSTIPLILWLIRNYFVLDDISGAAEKINFLGWKTKSFSEIWHHPIFTLKGSLFFFSELIKRFWRGELVWFLKPMASKGLDLFYVISSAVLIIISSTSIIINKDRRKNTILNICFAIVMVSVIMLICLSILYDFGKCWYPSQKYPYFTSGRLILTMLLPFLIIYLNGLEKLLEILRIKIDPLIFVIIIVITITVSEIILSYPVFGSPYNWYHLV